MKMKNVLMILITLAVVFAMAGAVSAVYPVMGFKDPDGSIKDTDSMNVTYLVKNNYVVEIPADVTISDGLVSDDNYVNATDVRIEPDHFLIVNLTAGNPVSANGLYSLVNKGSYIHYYINVTNSSKTNPVTKPVQNTQTFLKVESGHPYPGKEHFKGFRGIGDYVKLTFQTTQNFIDNATRSGVHQDSLTFMLDVVEE